MIKENSKMKYHVDLYRFFLHLHVKSFWIGLDWIGLDWIGLDWIGLDWIGLDWIDSFCPYKGNV
jgi:hypothetical protein